MIHLVSAYNGETHTLLTDNSVGRTGNTVGSLSKEQRLVVVGCLLGDGAMRCRRNALLEVNHSFAQRDYVDWKYQKLQQYVSTIPKMRRSNGKRIAYRFTTRSLPEFTELYYWFYGKGYKEIPSDLELFPLTLAIWVMDDGSKSYRAMYLNTQQFRYQEQQLLIRKLAEAFGIRAYINRDKQYYRIRISVGSVGRLYKIVKPHILPMFRYKFPLMTP
jgi:hypothetical protein